MLENLRQKNSNIPNLYNILLSYQITNAMQTEENINYKTEWTFNGYCADDIDIHIYDINDTGNLNIAYDYKTSFYADLDIENVHKNRDLKTAVFKIFRFFGFFNHDDFSIGRG